MMMMMIFDDSVTWTQAGDKCVQQNGYLASWETRHEFRMVQALFKEHFCKYTITPFLYC